MPAATPFETGGRSPSFSLGRIRQDFRYGRSTARWGLLVPLDEEAAILGISDEQPSVGIDCATPPFRASLPGPVVLKAVKSSEPEDCERVRSQ